MARISLSATGFYATPKISYDRTTFSGRPFYYYAYGAAVSEVVIDTLTGEHRLVRVDILHDCGKSLNPAIDLGQIEGGFIQGAGWLTTEELWWNEQGELKTHAPSTYKIPTCSDVPVDLRVAMLDGLHLGDVEIVSPQFNNARVLDPAIDFIPKHSRPQSAPAADAAPVDVAFDKAEEAEGLSAKRLELSKLEESLKELQKEAKGLSGSGKEAKPCFRYCKARFVWFPCRNLSA